MKIPKAPASIEKGVALKDLLGLEALEQLASNICCVYSYFDKKQFIKDASKNMSEHTLTQRSTQISVSLKDHLPSHYTHAIHILLKTLTPPLLETQGNGLAPMFYMPYCNFVALYGLIDEYNGGESPWMVSMEAQKELTKRYTCEYSMRPFLEADQDRVIAMLNKWMYDPNPHVRRLCSESTRPRLPWAAKISSLAQDPTICLSILEHLKNDSTLYVRRSVANHLGDLAKDHLNFILKLAWEWLPDASKELKWVIRHALRHPAKKKHEETMKLRLQAK